VPRIASIEGVQIVLWPNDHPPPHFHAIIAEYEAKMSIETGDVLSGSLPKAKLRAILSWLDLNRDALAFRWSELRAEQRVREAKR
jgi:hypothetical protein